jgi:hypothetical protein
MTGILDIVMGSMLSSYLNCVIKYDISDGSYSKYYGFN